MFDTPQADEPIVTPAPAEESEEGESTEESADVVA